MIIDTDDIKQEIMCDLKDDIEEMIHDVISDYFTHEIEEEAYEALQAKFRAIIREQSTSGIIKEIQHEYNQAIKKLTLAAGQTPIAMLSDKVDALARNMDALYLMINSK